MHLQSHHNILLVTIVMSSLNPSRFSGRGLIEHMTTGPIALPKDAEYILSRTTGVHGFYGASSVERLPVEDSIKAVVADFKELKAGRVTGD